MIKLTKKEKQTILKNLYIDCYVGLPGSGKTTIAAAEASKALKKGIKVYSNVPIKGCIKYSCEDLGLFDVSNSLIIIDEAGIEFNNRRYASFKDYTLRFFKLHRHYHTRIIVFSQANDSDKVIRSLSRQNWIVHRKFFGLVAACTCVHTNIDVSDTGDDVIRKYSLPHPFIQIFERKRYFMPLYWKYFDSWEAPVLPEGPVQIY